MTEAQFRIAIAGYGWWGQHMVRRLTGHPWIVAANVVEPNEALHEKIAAAGPVPVRSLDDVLADDRIDAVILTTPNRLHEEQVKEVAAAGKHVFCEKPLTLQAEAARRAVAACAEAGVQLGIGHERRYEAAIVALREMLDAGELGTIMHAEAAFSHDKLIHVQPGDWRASKADAPAGAMTGMGIHLTDMLISFFGEVETVQAIVTQRSLPWETGDTTSVQLAFRDGPSAQFSAILHTPHFIRLHVFGNRKWVEIINDTHPDTPGGLTRMTISETGKEPEVRTYEWTDTVVANLTAFARACRGEAPYPFTHRQMIHNIEVLEAITQAAEDRSTIHMPMP